jgi:hypothetical protein
MLNGFYGELSESNQFFDHIFLKDKELLLFDFLIIPCCLGIKWGGHDMISWSPQSSLSSGRLKGKNSLRDLGCKMIRSIASQD